ncbi:hypothetical protein MW887_003793 [Aspergillus wentii]|nr:hypothetical protein MW887_003793 [Aspergillus wentii]
MGDRNRPPPFPYTPYSSSSSGFQGDDSSLTDWTVRRYSQPSFGPQVNTTVETAPGFSEDSPSTSRVPAGDRPWSSKVPIPRSANSSQWTSSGRVSRACENCREQKAKCSGHRPSCQRCLDTGARCSYGDRKREKTAKEITDLKVQVAVFERLMREIFPTLDHQAAQHVEKTLNENQFQNRDKFLHSLRNSTTPPPLMMSDSPHSSGPLNVIPASSLGAADYTDEDFNRDEKAQAMGFVGEHSEIAWLYRLKRELEQNQGMPGNPSSNPHREDRLSVASVNFFLDDKKILLEGSDASQRPSQAVADSLVGSYFESVHPYFPIIGKMLFLQQFKSYNDNPRLWPGKRWMAILNLVFAIAAKYSQLAQQSMDPGSWRICNISIRSAVTMGLNLRSEANHPVRTSKEARYRVWWSLQTLDSLLSVMTGRPPSSSEGFFTTPLPVPFEEEDFGYETVTQLITDHEARTIFMDNLLPKGSEQSTEEHTITLEASGFQVPTPRKQCEQIVSSAMEFLFPNNSLCFLYFADLTMIMRESVDTLYAPGAAWNSWSEIEQAVLVLNSKTEAWLSGLPESFQFTGDHETGSSERQRLWLAFCFYSTKIILSQPCLRCLTWQPCESGLSENFSVAMAGTCVDSARQMLDLLPEEPDTTWLYRLSPWSCILHYIVQCTTVLLIDLFTRAKPGTVDYAKALRQTSKALAWLQKMAAADPSSERAWLICKDLFSHHDPEVRIKQEE